MTLSVCTIGHGRAGHLVNLVEGLRRQEDLPTELVIGVMQPKPYALPAADFPIRQVLLGGDGLTLATARNAAARAAVGRDLVFLDIDCIPDPTLVADYRWALAQSEGLLMGEVLYLPSGSTDRGVDFARFASLAVRHSERAGPPADAFGDCDDYRCFWSLNFAIARRTFERVGGFDERYSGYGGEDTDFGRMAVTAGVPLKWVAGARAYHQYHPHHMPPVHHIDSVIANAITFSEKWGEYTMEHWLGCFELMGLLSTDGGHPTRVREVTDADLVLTAQQSHEPYASAATVFALLEGRAAITSS